jgi:hypothetical protein
LLARLGAAGRVQSAAVLQLETPVCLRPGLQHHVEGAFRGDGFYDHPCTVRLQKCTHVRCATSRVAHVVQTIEHGDEIEMIFDNGFRRLRLETDAIFDLPTRSFSVSVSTLPTVVPLFRHLRDVRLTGVEAGKPQKAARSEISRCESVSSTFNRPRKCGSPGSP